MMAGWMAIRTLVTWNVLHGIHGWNWGEPAVRRRLDEPGRAARIAAKAAAFCASPGAVVCLQEVSGDQLARLRDALPDGVAVFAHRYPRVPQIRR